jgi:CubicO group peptidase (beta-lactamase class C family)
MCSRVADLAPLWTPGTRIEYHALTYGWILGEVARRVDGRNFARLLREEITQPLGTEGIFVGIPDEAESRVARLEEHNPAPPPPDDGTPQSVPSSLGPIFAWMNRPDVRRACIPASNGVMSALAIARHYAALLPGGVDGIQLLPDERIRLATEPQKPEHPENADYPKNWGLGYAIGGEGSLFGGPRAFGHGGYGDSTGFADPEAGMAVGLTKNLYNGDRTTRVVLETLRNALAK